MSTTGQSSTEMSDGEQSDLNHDIVSDTNGEESDAERAETTDSEVMLTVPLVVQHQLLAQVQVLHQVQNQLPYQRLLMILENIHFVALQRVAALPQKYSD